MLGGQATGPRPPIAVANRPPDGQAHVWRNAVWHGVGVGCLDTRCHVRQEQPAPSGKRVVAPAIYFFLGASIL